MVELPNPNPIHGRSRAERHLGLAAALIGAVGVVAICGSPEALWDYVAAVAAALATAARAVLG